MKRLLLIEDNVTNRKLMGDVLRMAGYEVDETDNADDGMVLALVGDFDLVLMDIQLPGTDGLEATRILRANLATRELPILAVTARAMKGDEKLILEAGCDGYLAKPIAYKDLLMTVAALLENGSEGGLR